MYCIGTKRIDRHGNVTEYRSGMAVIQWSVNPWTKIISSAARRSNSSSISFIIVGLRSLPTLDKLPAPH